MKTTYEVRRNSNSTGRDLFSVWAVRGNKSKKVSNARSSDGNYTSGKSAQNRIDEMA